MLVKYLQDNSEFFNFIPYNKIYVYEKTTIRSSYAELPVLQQ